MKTNKKNIVKSTVNLLALSLVLASGGLYGQTYSITSEENIKFNTENKGLPTLSFDNNWTGTLRYNRSSRVFTFNRELNVLGDVGIGTSNPVHKLDVNDDGGVIAGFGQRKSGGRLIYVVANDTDSWIGTRNNHAFSLRANNSEKVKIHTNGDVTINSGGDSTLNQVSMNTDAKVNHAALTIAGATYIGPQAEKASTGDLTKFDQEYIDDYNLWVEDGIVTEDLILVHVDTWSDHVFKKDYELPKLSEVERFIKQNGHLKNMPSEEKVLEEGYKQHDMNKGLLEKVEELTLYIIAQEKRIGSLEKQLNNNN